MTSTEDERFTLIWAEGLCRCGCGQPVTKPKNRFVNGHDGMLMDLLVDAFRDARSLRIVRPGMEAEGHWLVAPLDWARQSFSASGLAHFDWLVQRGAPRPATSHTEVPEGFSVARSPEEKRSGLLGELDREEGSLAADLELIRSVIERAATGDDVVVDGLRRRIREAEERAAAVEAQLAEATQPVVVGADEVGKLSDAQVITALRARVRASALVFDHANYDGDAGEVWDLYSLFRPGDVGPVAVAAARALLGQGVR